MLKSGGENGFPNVSTSLLLVFVSSEAMEDSDVDEGETLGVSAGEGLIDEATLLAVVAETGARERVAGGGSAVADIFGEVEGVGERRVRMIL